MELPRLTLVPELALDGSASAAAAVAIPDAIDGGHVRWVSQEEMRFDVYPELALSPGLYGLRVENPTGETASATAQLLAVPAPVLTSLQDDLICTAEGLRKVTLHGTGFLVDGASLPIVHVGILGDFTPTYVTTDCITLPGTRQVQSCTALQIDIPESTPAGIYDITVTNPAPAGCTTSNPVALFVADQPEVTAIEPLQMCLSQLGTLLQVTGLGFLEIDGVTPTLVLADGATDVYTLKPASADLTGCTTYNTSAGPTEVVRQCSGFTVTIPQDAIAVALASYAARVENPEPAGCESAETTVINYPPPQITAPSAEAPLQICQGGGDLQITGASLRAGATVRVGGVAATNAAAETCDSDGLCTTLNAFFGFLPRSLIDLSPVTLEVVNADGCAVSVASAVNVTAGILVLYADPPVIYDGFSNTLTVYATNSESRDITRVNLVPPSPDVPITLCDDEGDIPCTSTLERPGDASISPPYNGRFTVPVPAGVLTQLIGTPTEMTFGLSVQAGSGCGALLPDAVQVISEPEAGVTLTLEPSSAKHGDETAVSITMTAPSPGLFETVPTAYLSGGPLTSVTYVSNASLTAVVPATLSLSEACLADASCIHEDFDLAVVNPTDGRLFVQPAAFRLSKMDSPKIANIVPGQLPSAGGAVTLTGANFQADLPGTPADPTQNATVRLLECEDNEGIPVASPAVTVTAVSDTSLEVTVGAGTVNSICLFEVENPRDEARARFSALVFTNSAGNIPKPRVMSALMNTGRRRHGAAAVSETQAAHFLYVAGGDANSDGNSIDTVEFSPLALTGETGAFVESRYKLTARPDPDNTEPGRTDLALLNADRALYAIGGVTRDGTVTTTVERAVVLHPDEVLDVSLETFDFVAPGASGLAAGGWIYQVAIVFAATDPINPCGESLPSRPFAIRLPEVDDGLRLTVSWLEPDTTTGTLQGRQIAGYRLYRTPAANQPLSAIELLNDIDGAGTLTYVDDDSAPASITPIIGCTDAASVPNEIQPVAGMQPQSFGATSRWVSAGVPQLNTARRAAGAAAVIGRGDTAGSVFLYVMSGYNDVEDLASYEVLELPVDPMSNPASWEVGQSWAQVDLLAATRVRSYAGLYLLQRENSSLDGETFEITDDSQYLALGPGIREGSEQGEFDSWAIGADGQLDGARYDSIDIPSAGIAAYGNVAANQRVLTFGGTQGYGNIQGVVWSIVEQTPGDPTTSVVQFENSYNSAGDGMSTPRGYHASVLDRAFIYLTGGQDSSGTILNSIDLAIW